MLGTKERTSSRAVANPWDVIFTPEEKKLMAAWPPHAPGNPEVDLDYVLELSKETPFRRECELAVSILNDDIHWKPSKTDILVPKSRFKKAHMAVMCARRIMTEFLGDHLAWGLMTTVPEPTKVPPR